MAPKLHIDDTKFFLILCKCAVNRVFRCFCILVLLEHHFMHNKFHVDCIMRCTKNFCHFISISWKCERGRDAKSWKLKTQCTAFHRCCIATYSMYIVQLHANVSFPHFYETLALRLVFFSRIIFFCSSPFKVVGYTTCSLR